VSGASGGSKPTGAVSSITAIQENLENCLVFGLAHELFDANAIFAAFRYGAWDKLCVSAAYVTAPVAA
jgi:hypothetical protein